MTKSFYSFVLISALFFTGCNSNLLDADAGKDQVVMVGQEVILDGSNSTGANNKTLLYHWTQTKGTSVDLSASNNVRATFLAPNVSETEELVFKLSVTEGFTQNTSVDSVAVTVNAPLDTTKPNYYP